MKVLQPPGTQALPKEQLPKETRKGGEINDEGLNQQVDYKQIGSWTRGHRIDERIDRWVDRWMDGQVDE